MNGKEFPASRRTRVGLAKIGPEAETENVNRLDTFAIFDGVGNLALEMRKTSVIIGSTPWTGVVSEKRGRTIRFLNPVQLRGQDCLSKPGVSGLALGV